MRSRTVRWLILAGLVCTLSLVARKTAGQSATPWPADAPQYKLYMIGNAHIDIPWLWPWTESMSVGLSTFRSALDRMNEFPDFKFTASSAQLYEWAAAADPGMIAEIRRRVAEGRWGVVGGWWIEPDVNIPNGESLIRQGLYSQRLFQELLGRPARVGFNPDSFGHPGTLPQILKLEGMNSYVFMRPGATEKELPAAVPVLFQGIHKGTRPESASFLSVDVPNVVVSDVKQAEDGNDLIIRCYETAGRATKASLDLGLVHRHWTGDFHPLEIKALRVPLTAAGKIREVNALEK